MRARAQGGAGRRTRFTVPSRRLQRILEPSGDHRGLVYSPAASVIWRALPPSRSMTPLRAAMDDPSAVGGIGGVGVAAALGEAAQVRCVRPHRREIHLLVDFLADDLVGLLGLDRADERRGVEEDALAVGRPDGVDALALGN